MVQFHSPFSIASSFWTLPALPLPKAPPK